MDIMSIFNSQAPNPLAVPQQQQQQPKPDPAFQPSNNADPKQQPSDPQKSPLDSLADVYKLEAPKDGETPPDPNAPIFTLDPAKLQEQVSKMNFADSPEVAQLAQKALQGDPAALAQAINAAAQKAFTASLQISSNFAERAARASIERVQNELPQRMRDSASLDSLAELNPVFAHPAMAPIVDSVRQQYMRKHADASPREIAKMVNNHFGEISKQLTSKNADPTGHRKVETPDENFAEFFVPGQRN